MELGKEINLDDVEDDQLEIDLSKLNV
jgi:hypothetical protein